MEQRNQLLFKVEDYNCVNGSICTMLCISSQCKENALVCNNEKCSCRLSKHQQCRFEKLDIIIKQINSIMKSMTKEDQLACNKILEIYDEMLDKISQSKVKFVDFIDMFGLGENAREFVTLYNSQRISQITGDLIHKISQEMNTQYKNFILDYQFTLKWWKQKKCQFDSVLNGLYGFQIAKSFTSRIICIDGFEKIANFFSDKIRGFELLYRASDHKFSVQKFHSKCDDIAHTVVIVQTEFDKIIGGYTPIKWSTNGFANSDPSKQSFLFSVTLNEKYKLIEPNRAVYHSRLHGPIFGGGHDLHIGSNCNNFSTYTFANFGKSYNNGSYQNNQQAFQAFSGQQSGFKFKIKDYEVFKVIWKDKQL